MDPKFENLICKEIFTIDPGISNGGIVKFSDRVETWNMPDSYYDLCDFMDYQKSICKLPLFLIEKVQLWKKDKDEPGKIFGIEKMLDHYAELRAAIRSRGFQFIEIHPLEWQTYLNIKIPGEEKKIRKARYKDIAKEMYPTVKVTLRNCDALLILEYARRMLKYNSLALIKKLQKKQDKSKLFSK